MAFGEGFKHMDTFEQLEDGNYRAKIIKAEIPETASDKFSSIQYYPHIFTTRSILQGLKKLVDKL